MQFFKLKINEKNVFDSDLIELTGEETNLSKCKAFGKVLKSP